MSVCLSVRPFVRPVPSPSPSLSPKKVIETENFAKKSYQIHYKGDKNTSRVVLPPPLLLPRKPLHLWARRSRATYIQHNLEFHHLSRVGPKQLCALAHLGSTREAGTFQYYSKAVVLVYNGTLNLEVLYCLGIMFHKRHSLNSNKQNQMTTFCFKFHIKVGFKFHTNLKINLLQGVLEQRRVFWQIETALLEKAHSARIIYLSQTFGN